MAFTLAIIGRPNVGKSTLFNRLVGRKLALVDDQPGVTRDRREGAARLRTAEFTVIDTAGLDHVAGDTLIAAMRDQTAQAIAQADAILFMIDARAGVTPLDGEFAREIRKAGKPVILAANKAEGSAGAAGLLEAHALGLGEPVAISAEHGEGLAELYEALEPLIARHGRMAGGPVQGEAGEDGEDDAERPLMLAIVGRPNAGKSTLANMLFGEERLLAGPEPGLTRDAISLDWEWRGENIRLVDTAGLRKRAKVKSKLEKLSVADTLRAVRFAEVVVLVIDAQQPFDKQDLQIADLVAREGRALVIAVNKWDLVTDKRAARAELEERAERLLPQLRGVKLVTLSGLTGAGTNKLMPAVFETYRRWCIRVSTAALNRWLDGAVARHPPPAARGRRIKLRYATQAKARPPSFIVFCSRPDALPESYSRYLINELRKDFDLKSVPIRLHMRKGDNPYASKSRK